MPDFEPCLSAATIASCIHSLCVSAFHSVCIALLQGPRFHTSCICACKEALMPMISMISVAGESADESVEGDKLLVLVIMLSL